MKILLVTALVCSLIQPHNAGTISKMMENWPKSNSEGDNRMVSFKDIIKTVEELAGKKKDAGPWADETKDAIDVKPLADENINEIIPGALANQKNDAMALTNEQNDTPQSLTGCTRQVEYLGEKKPKYGLTRSQDNGLTLAQCCKVCTPYQGFIWAEGESCTCVIPDGEWRFLAHGTGKLYKF